MITSTPGPRGPMLSGDLPAGARAYIDADWIPAQGGPVPALIVRDGAIGRSGEPTTPLPVGLDADRAAAGALVAVAREAADAVASIDPRQVAVTGAGAVAAAVRAALGGATLDAVPDAAGIAAVVEASGDPAVIQLACERLADLGTLVLVGEPAGRSMPFNLYPDLHARGLRVVGVAPALGGPPVDAPRAEVDALASTMVTAQPGTPLVPGAWYRLGA